MATVLQQAAGSVTTSYGIGTTLLTTAGTQSALVLFAGWNYGVAGTFVTTPAINVSDSAGNLWKQVAITQGGTTVAGNTRSGIWMTVNARPVSWVSVGLTGYTTTAEWNIAEIAGLPQNIAIDYSIGVNSSGSFPSLTGVATGNDFGFAVISSGYNPTAITGPAGWTALGTVTAGTGNTGGYTTCYWNPGITAGTATYAGTVTGTIASYSYALCAITAAVSPPPQYDIRHPLIVVEAAFGATPGNPSSSVDYTYDASYVSWQDISTRVIGDAAQGRISASAGRQYELQQEEAGELSVFLDNHDGAFTPTNPGSPFYSNALNSNMSFQASVSPWTARNGAALTQASGTAWATGLNALATVSALVTAGAAAAPGIQSELVPVNANYPYSASAWAYGGTAWATGAQVGLAWYKADKTTLISTSLSAPVALPAGQWKLYTMGGSVPPASAAYAQEVVQLSGTPGAGFTFGVAEAALTTGSAGSASTGLVALKTPVRVSAWWQGRQWPVWMGYVERWPQSWPEMPQWGFSNMIATDAISIAGANSMNSALIGEVLIDGPVAYLPCNEQYTTANVGATPQFQFLFGTSPYFAPSDANGLAALNKSALNQVTGVYADGSGQQVSTGLAMNFFGDNGTGMGATGYQGEVRSQRGPSMMYSDPALLNLMNSAAGYSVEFWFTWGGTANQDVSLLTMYSTPSAYWNQAGQQNGAFINLAVIGSNLYLQVNNGGQFLAGTVAASTIPQHVVFTSNAVTGGAQIYLNGQVPAAEGGIAAPSAVPLDAIVLGPGRYSYDCNNSANYSGFNFSASHLAVYNYQLTSQRIFSHYQTGVQGWSGVSAAQRFAQILTWGQLGLKRGGYCATIATGTPEITQIGPAYQLSGSPASDAVNNVALSEGGQYFVEQNGTLTYLERVTGYNQPVAATFGDNATAAPDILNANPGFQFSSSVAGWTAQNGTVTYSAQGFQGYGSLLLTPSGTAVATAFSPQASAAGGTVYTAGAWLYSPAGGTVSAGVTFYSGASPVASGSHALVVPAGCWAFTGGTVPAPAGLGITSASVYISGGAGSVITSYAFLMLNSSEIPYMKETEFDLDDTYVYNEVTAAQIDGPNQLIVADNRSIPSEYEYFRRSALSFQSDVVSPYDVSDVTTWSINQFSQPITRASSIEIHASTDPMVIYPAVLGIGIGNIVQVYRRPVGGAVISELGIIERVQYSIGSRYFYITYQVSPYTPSSVLCADTAGFDTPGTTTLGW